MHRYAPFPALVLSQCSCLTIRRAELSYFRLHTAMYEYHERVLLALVRLFRVAFRTKQSELAACLRCINMFDKFWRTCSPGHIYRSKSVVFPALLFLVCDFIRMRRSCEQIARTRGTVSSQSILLSVSAGDKRTLVAACACQE